MTDLAEVLRQGVRLNPDGVALREPGGREIAYRDLDRLVDDMAAALTGLGAVAGDRIAICLPKSIGTVVAMQAALRLGAAYVPIDAAGPVARSRALLADARVAACVTFRDRAPELLAGELAGIPVLALDADGAPVAPNDAYTPPRPESRGGDDLAYILYTSGSTGRPKGVCISHRNALAFVDWAHGELGPTTADRFANHAPLHFDLSVLDLYVAFRAGATVVLVPDGLSVAAPRLVDLIDSEAITVWYSVPSVLALMIDQGGLLDSTNAPRAILFAGEPFPIEPLRQLRETFPAARLLNLYGPTETNVCTFEEVGPIPAEQTAPVPIGRACGGNRVWAESADGVETPLGERGELVVDGPTVMLGYWGEPPQTGPYRTGDVVRRIGTDRYEYVGRRDSMVKIRGHRVELGEVEAALNAHPRISEAAAVAAGSGPAARLVGFVSCRGEPPSLLDVKRHCAERLPRSMIVHELRVLEELPRNRNGKLDRRLLASGLPGGSQQ